MFIEFNPNPKKKLVDDCVIRAICLVTGKDWYTVRTELFLMGLHEGDYEWKNYIWGGYLERIGLVLATWIMWRAGIKKQQTL